MKKLGSSLGLVTLSGIIVSGVSAGNVFAFGEFTGSKLFTTLCSLFSDEKLKELLKKKDEFFEEQKKAFYKNEEQLKKKKLLSLVMLWEFAEKVGNSESSQENKDLLLVFKLHLLKVLENKDILNNKLQEFFKSKDFENMVNERLIFKDIVAANRQSIVEVLLADTYRDLFFNKESGEPDHLKIEKYSNIILELKRNYFFDLFPFDFPCFFRKYSFALAYNSLSLRNSMSQLSDDIGLKKDVFLSIVTNVKGFIDNKLFTLEDILEVLREKASDSDLKKDEQVVRIMDTIEKSCESEKFLRLFEDFQYGYDRFESESSDIKTSVYNFVKLIREIHEILNQCSANAETK